jgi:circadian clock protein KaiB
MSKRATKAAPPAGRGSRTGRPRKGTAKAKGKSKAAAEVAADHVDTWRLRLYVAGQSPKCVAAVRNLNRFCEEHLSGRYTVEVIDLLENPRLARDHQILAIPTLVRQVPEPLRKIVGDLSDRERMLVGFDLQARSEASVSEQP